MKKWQALLIQVGLSFLGLVVSFLPRKAELWMGPRLGQILLLIGKKRRSVAWQNLANCYPQQSEAWLTEHLKKNYQHYGLLVFELLHLFSPLKNHYKNYVLRNAKLSGIANWHQAQDQGKGVLFVSSHLANWELMVACGAMAGVPIMMVTKHLKPEWLHKKIESSRASTQVRAVYEPRTLPEIMRTLRKKEAVGFVMDQYAGPPIGIEVDFFGVKVGTLAAVGLLAERTGAAVLPVKTFRDENGVVQVVIEPALDFSNTSNNQEATTQALAKKVEDWVRQYPEQWLWIHRRFKNVVWPHKIA